MAELETALGELKGTNSVSRVRLSAPMSFVQFCLAPLLPAFHVQHPDILLDLRATNRNVDLRGTASISRSAPARLRGAGAPDAPAVSLFLDRVRVARPFLAAWDAADRPICRTMI